MTRQQVFQAIPYNGPSSEAAEPLIQSDEKKLDERIFSRFKMSALALGLLVGLFIQLSTLGANFLVISLWGEDILNKTRQDIVWFSLIWSFLTSAMAIVILAFLRGIVSLTYFSILKESSDILEEMVLHLECRFVVGALIGVCVAWTVTDAVMGMTTQIIYSAVTLAISLVWCRVMMSCLSNSDQDDEEDEEEVMIV